VIEGQFAMVVVFAAVEGQFVVIAVIAAVGGQFVVIAVFVAVGGQFVVIAVFVAVGGQGQETTLDFALAVGYNGAGLLHHKESALAAWR
jgi:hypothetical protein